MGVLAEVQKGLEKAHDHSTRSGKWSTVGEVRSYETETSLTRLRDLVSDGAATEKKVGGVLTKLFKPTRAGGGGAGGLGDSDGDKDRGDDGKKPRRPGRKRPGRPTGRHKPHGKKPGRRGDGKPDDTTHRHPKRPKHGPKRPPRKLKPGKSPKKPRAYKKPHPRDRVTKGGVGNVIGQGIGTLLVGGMGGGTGGGVAGRTMAISPKMAM